MGPSGSGKSSILKAGVIPAIRKDDDSDELLVAEMVPGSHPFAELEAALLRSSLAAPDSIAEQLGVGPDGVLRAVLRVLPDPSSRMLLAIDQFEELFSLVDDVEVRARFLAHLMPVLDDPHGRTVVVLTLRSDFYARPLEYPEFGARLGPGVVNVTPMLPEELEAASLEPARRAGVSLEPSLLSRLLSDVIGRPGALPLFQYTLTELFERRHRRRRHRRIHRIGARSCIVGEVGGRQGCSDLRGSTGHRRPVGILHRDGDGRDLRRPRRKRPILNCWAPGRRPLDRSGSRRRSQQLAVVGERQCHDHADSDVQVERSGA